MKRVALACGQALAFAWIFFPYAILFSQSWINNPDPQMFLFMKKRLYGPFSWMKFNRLKVRMRTTLRRRFTFYIPLREHQQKTFVTLSGFWPLSCWEILVNLLKKENSWRKSFFQINVEWSSKNLWKMISADVKANKNNNK